jgi:nucleotide-binding universal stress UspA family protein
MLDGRKGVEMRVLYATDGSSPAREGEGLITSLFDRSKADIRVFAVTPEPGYDLLASYGISPSGIPEPPPLDVPILDADRVTEAAGDHLAANGLRVSSSAARGDPALEIVKTIESEDPFDLVVLGASHTTWMGNFLMGRVSMHVLHHAPCSVVVTHRAPTGTGRVLVGADGSEGARSSFRTAAEVLDRDRCTVEVATVVSHPWMFAATYPAGTFLGHVPDPQGLEKERIEQGRVIAQRASAEARTAGFKVMEEAVLVGRPGHQLLEEADNIGADLVVVGSRGIGAIGRTFLGSVSDQVARHAPATFVGRRQS